jgi:''chromo'' (CHRromatin Organisation MOdifier) domain./PHD-finger.
MTNRQQSDMKDTSSDVQEQEEHSLPQHPADDNVAAAASTPSASTNSSDRSLLPPPPPSDLKPGDNADDADITVQDQEYKSWHMEMLLSLFMRMDEEELESLAKQSDIDPSFLFSSSVEVTTTSNTEGGSHKREGETEMCVMDNNINDVDNSNVKGTNNLQQQQRRQEKNKKRQFQSGRKRSQWEISHEENHHEEVDPSQLPILQQVFKDMGGENSSAEPCLIPVDDVNKYFPKKYKREGYANYDAISLEKVAKTHLLQSPYKDKGQNVLPSQKWKPIALKYNECSVRAISSWAFQSMDTPKERILRGKSLDVCYQPVIAEVKFRSCALCQKYGHYEIECEEVARRNIPKELIPRALQEEQKAAKELAIQKTLKGFIRKEQKNKKYDLRARQHELKRILSPWINVEGYDDGNDKGEMKNNGTNGRGLSFKRTHRHQVLANNEDESSQALFSEVCEVCGTNFSVQDILLCDICDKLYHRQCLDPPLDELPEGDWFCDACKACDSEVSSVTVIEGLDDFVIEQRKLSCAEKEMVKRESDLRLGFRNNPWNVSVTIADADVDTDEVYGEEFEKDDDFEQSLESSAKEWLDEDKEDPLFEGLSDLYISSNDSNLLEVGDLCWAKRRGTHTSSKTVYGKDFFWPGVVVFVHKNSIAHDGAVQTPYIVKFFNLPAGGRIRASHVLPFFRFYEALGHNRIMSNRLKTVDWFEDFQSAVLNAINQVGLKSLDDALIFSQDEFVRDEMQGLHVKESSTRQTTVQGSRADHERARRPKEWQDVDEAVVDGITILSKPKDNAKSNDELRTDISLLENNMNGVVEGEKNQEMEKLLKEIMKLSSPENVIGSLVAYDMNGNSNGKSSSMRFGVVSDFNKAFGKLLIRHLPDIHHIITNHTNTVVASSTNATSKYLKSFSTRIGSSEWFSPKDVIYITNGPSKGNANYCKSAVNLTLEMTREQLRKYHQLLALEKEYKMEELSPTLTNDSMVSGSVKPSSDDASTLTSVDHAGKRKVTPSKSSLESENVQHRISGYVDVDQVPVEKDCIVFPEDNAHNIDKIICPPQAVRGRTCRKSNNATSNDKSSTDVEEDFVDNTQHDKESNVIRGNINSSSDKGVGHLELGHPDNARGSKRRGRAGRSSTSPKDKSSTNDDTAMFDKSSDDIVKDLLLTTTDDKGSTGEEDVTSTNDKSNTVLSKCVLGAAEHDTGRPSKRRKKTSPEPLHGGLDTSEHNKERTRRRGNSMKSKDRSSTNSIEDTVDANDVSRRDERLKRRKGDSTRLKDDIASDSVAEYHHDSSRHDKGPNRRHKASNMDTATAIKIHESQASAGKTKTHSDNANNDHSISDKSYFHEKETNQDGQNKRSRSLPTTTPNTHGSFRPLRSNLHSKSVDVSNTSLNGNDLPSSCDWKESKKNSKPQNLLDMGNSRKDGSTNIPQAANFQKSTKKAGDKMDSRESGRKRNEPINKSKNDSSNREATLPSQKSSANHGSGEIFEAERILADRSRGTNGSIREYLIKWKGFSNDHNSWENEHNILDKSFLKKYLCQKYITALKNTPDAKKSNSATARTIKALLIGIESIEKKHTPNRNTDDRVCPFCFKVIGGFKKIGGHLKSHIHEPNYPSLKDVSRFVEEEWFRRTKSK